MDIFLAYIFTFFLIFIIMPITYYILRFVLWLVLDYCGCDKSYSENRRDQQGRRVTFGHIYDRQGNIFTIANESSSNPLPHRCTDFFYVEPSSEDAARIRAQLEKDEKDLPTYEEVMAMSAAQAAAGTLSPPPTTASSTTIAITDATVPPYSEIDRNTTRAAPLTLESGATAWPIGNETAPSHGAGAASTSRAAAAAATSAPATTTVVTIANSVSNTSV
ncbi:uncharacterized protein LOC105216042 isoform X5 [Zeugodacus cucurbitae]|uniref:uncharacterized protein LOC105216042 isoform X5 n=1 Tax=Zeugodacus cucurbitae TaxID=28588 RepID=UPI0005967B3F|nr:uncharacterized protein LOC105216042 isoform X5 [Zeugodacus cucurbitae]